MQTRFHRGPRPARWFGGLVPQHIVSDMNTMHEQHEENPESLRHELLANLEGVEGCLTLLEGAGQLTGLQRQYMASSIQYAANLRALLEGLAECVQINRGRFISTAQKTDLNALLNSVVKPHVAPLAERGTELTVKIDPEVSPMLMLDRARLHLVLSNLLCAALDLAASGGISVEVKRSVDRPANTVFVTTCSLCLGYEHFSDLNETFPPPQGSLYLDSGFSFAQKLAKALGWRLTVRNQATAVAFFLELQITAEEKPCVLP